MQTDLDVLDRITNRLADAVACVQPESLGEPTVCSAWSVAELLDHLTGGNRFTVAILAGATASDALAQVRASFDSDHDPVAAVVDSGQKQLDAWSPDMLSPTYHHVAGDISGEQVLRLRIHDMSIHTWDLLQAVNPTQGLDPVYVRWAIDELAMAESLTARHVATGFQRPSKPCELLLAFGRQR